MKNLSERQDSKKATISRNGNGMDIAQSNEEFSALLRVSTETVESYLRDYNFNKKVRNDPKRGSQSKLTEEECEKRNFLNLFLFFL